MKQNFSGWKKRLLALWLCLCLPLSCALSEGLPAADETPALQATQEPTGEPTPTADATPAPTAEPTAVPSLGPTVEPTLEPTVEPTAVPSLGPTAEPTAIPSLGPTVEPTAVPSPGPTVEPTAVPSPGPTVEPTAVPSPGPTVEPTVEPTVGPTLEPTIEPVVEPTPTPSPLPWDESQCDHASANCLQAPACDQPGCTHIGVTVSGLDYPLCEKGRWLLDQQDALQRAGAGRLRAARRGAFTLDLDQESPTFYRSGNYTITQGAQNPKASVTVKKDRVVSLTLRAVTAQALTLEENAQAILDMASLSAISEIKLGKNAQVTLMGVSGITLGTVTLDEGKTASLSVQSGSVKGSFAEKSGRVLSVFPSQGAQAVTVAGEAFAAEAIEGSFYLWLKPAAENYTWQAALKGTTLDIAQEPRQPVDQAIQQDTPPAGYEPHTLAAGAGTLGPASRLMLDGTAQPLYYQSPQVFYLPVLPQGQRYEISLSQDVLTVVTRPVGMYALNELPDGFQFTSDALVYGDPAQHCSLNLVVASGVTVTFRDVNLGGASGASGAIRLESGATALFEGACAVNALEGAGTVTAYGRLTTAAIAPSLGVTGNVANAGETPPWLLQITNDTGAPVANQPVTLHLKGQADRSFITFDDGTLKLYGISAQGQDVVVSSGDTVYTAVIQGGSPVTPGFEITDITALQGTGDAAGTLAISFTVPQGAASLGVQYCIGGEAPLDAFDPAALRVEGAASPLTLTGLTPGDTLTYRVYAALGNGLSLTADNQDGFQFSQVQSFTLVVPKVPYQPDFTAPSQAYTGQPYGFAPPLPQGVAYAYAGEGLVNGLPVNAGRYELVITVPQDHGVYLPGEIRQPFEITPGENPLAISVKDLTFGEKVKVQIDTNLGGEVSLRYQGTGDTVYDGRSAPTEAGKYQVTATAQATANVKEATAQAAFTIKRRTVTISPEFNQFKFEGEEDPAEFFFTFSGLLEEDELHGFLTRTPGEEAGSYPFRLDNLWVDENYILRLEKDAAEFLIMGMVVPTPGGSPTFERIIPVHQIIQLKDGRKLDVILNTVEKLSFTYYKYGEVVFHTDSMRPRPFSPSMRFNEATQQVMLHIQAEPALNDDGGYQTDDSGHIVYAGRTLRLYYNQLTWMQRQGVTHIGFQMKNALVTVAIADLQSDAVKALAKEQRYKASDLIYFLALDPAPQLTQAEKALAQGAVEDVYRLSVTAQVKNRTYDIAPLLTTLEFNMAMEDTAALLTAMDRYDPDAFEAAYSLYSLNGESLALPSAFVTPYMPSDEAHPYPRLMGTWRYLTSPLASGGLYTIKLTQGQGGALDPAPEGAN